MDQLLTDVEGKSVSKVIDCLSEIIREYGRIIRNTNQGFLTLTIALGTYISALENYSLEFDKTWDDLIKRTEETVKQIDETADKLKEKDLSYIK